MSDTFKIKRGVDIKLQGKAEQVYASAELPETFAVKPTDFPGARLKLSVREGDEVKAGTPILFSKDREEVVITSPVSGEVAEIRRGAKRKLLEVRILADKETKYIDFGSGDPSSMEAEEVSKKLLSSGCWAFMKQRPYNILANPNNKPKAIFISCFDSSPLGIDYDFALHGLEDEFQAGINALTRLTDGDVHLGVSADSSPSTVFTGCKGVKLHRFKGPHPAGNVGVQINRVDPINKGEHVWTLNPQQVAVIGRLFLTGKYDARINIPVAGSQIENPRYYKTLIGASIKNFVENNLKSGGNRFISGNVLTGTRITQDGYLGFFDQQVTVIPEGGEDQFFGWIAPNFDKFSISRALFSWMMPNKAYNLTADMNGEERAFVITGEYEKVFPFDIYPTQLLKSIMVKDIEAMENLGIYEVVEEDFALCEVVCTSKIPVQETIREGLDLMLQELGD
jgi:Na+-transporting NADH:ubiquinone oxidoreductase subunit A